MMQQASGSEAFERPRFRQDHLVAETIEDGEAKFIDVMDPDTGSMFRFYESEFSLACAMDGERDVPKLISWAREELGMLPTAAEVRDVIATLGSLGYLDLGEAARAAAAEPVPVAAEGPATVPVAAPSMEGLAPGVVVAPPPVTPPQVTDVELGSAGSQMKAPAPVDVPPAADIALGASGTTATHPSPPPVEDVALGAAGASEAQRDMSLDLSDHMAVRPDDVKEAVRASKVLQAVDIPQDLAAALEEPTVSEPAEEPPVEAKPEPAKPPVVEAKPEPVKPPVEVKPEPAKPAKPALPVTQAKPEEKPTPPPPSKVPEKQPVPPTPSTSQTSTRLIVLFVLLLLAFGAYLLWKHVLHKSNDDAGKTSQVQQPVKPPTPAPPPEPQPEPVKLSAFAPAPVEVQAPAAVTIEAIDPTKDVKAGAMVVRFSGSRPILAKIEAAQHEVTRVEKELANGKLALEKAQAGGNARAIKTAEAYITGREHSLAKKQETLAGFEAELAKHVMKAPGDGEVAVVAKIGKVNANAVLFTFTPAPVLVATFPKTQLDPAVASALAIGNQVSLEVKGSETKLTCKVSSTDDSGVKVECPDDHALVDAEVTFGGVVEADDKPTGDAPTEDKPTEDKPADDKPADDTPAPAENKAPAPAPAPAPRPVVRPRPTPKLPADKPADKPADAPADTKPADPKPADKPADPPAAPADPATP